MAEIATPVLEALGPLVQSLAALGYVPTASQFTPAHFGNFVVTFDNGHRTFELVRDRSQFIVNGKREDLEPFGLWRAFNTVAALEALLIAWLAKEGDA